MIGVRVGFIEDHATPKLFRILGVYKRTDLRKYRKILSIFLKNVHYDSVKNRRRKLEVDRNCVKVT